MSFPYPSKRCVRTHTNPNAVAPPEMRLLYESIRADGYTMPIVCYYAKSQDIYVIVDGFHRYRVMLEHPDIYEREGGVLPVSVIDKPLDQRMASTIRHNRARGSHDVDLMSNIVKELHELGRSDAWIAKHLGMDKDELLRLKQITGRTALFKDVKFGQAWQPMDEGGQRRMKAKRTTRCWLEASSALALPFASGETVRSLPANGRLQASK